MKRTIGIVFLLLNCIGLSAEGESLGLKTVVIDPGHGGKDPGCISRDKKTYEKNITLDIAKTLAEKIRKAYPDVKVVMTRETDVFVALNERAAIANGAHADLFISIHVNDNKSASPSGYSVHLLGQSSNKNRDLFANNMDVCARENSVIMLEDDYSVKYQGFNPADPESYIFLMLTYNAYLEQSLRFAEQVHSSLKGGPIAKDRGISQDPFYVLWATSMPAVLLELGFMSNASDLEKLRSKSGRNELAEKIFEAFSSYKNLYDESLNSANASTAVASASETNPTSSSESGSNLNENPFLFPGSRSSTTDSDSEKVNETAASQSEENSEQSPVEYGIQIFASKTVKDDKSLFLGYTSKVIFDAGLYKHFIALSDSKEKSLESLDEIRKKYPDAFLVEIRGGTVVKVR